MRRLARGQILVSVLGAAVFLALLTAFALWALDYQVDGTVTKTDCSRGDVTVHMRLFGMTHTVTGVPTTECLLLKPGNYVQYHIRTAHTRLFDSEGGDCIYDSVTGIC